MMGPLEVTWMPFEALIPYARNPRQGHAVAEVAGSIKEFGWRQPIVVDEEMVIVAGHARLQAAMQLGLTEVPVHVATDLDRWQAKAYRIVDNRSAEISSWVEELLAYELAELEEAGFDLSVTGFEGVQLERLLQLALEDAAPEDEDVDLTPPERPRSKAGELYTLGRHRVLCGDSRVAADVKRLVGRRKIDCLWTDPPYGVEYQGKTAAALTLQNDDLAGLPGLLTDAFAAADAVMAPAARFYIAAPAGPNGTAFRLAIERVKWRFHQALVWVKQAFVLGHSDYHYQHEDVLYGWKAGEGRAGRGNHTGTRWWGSNAESSVFAIDRPMRSEDHPTEKPTALIRRQLQNSTRPGDRVLDLFGGSGATLIACEQLGRRAFLVELDPGYCDVIRRRYEAYIEQKEGDA